MRISAVVALIVYILVLPTAAGAEGMFAIGGQSAGYIEGLSLKAKVSSSVALQGIFGYSSMSIDEPTVEVEGENQEDVPMSFSSSGWALGARVLFSATQAGNADVYVGAGFAYHSMSNTIEGDPFDENIELTLDGSATEFSGFFGAEYRPDDLPNAGLSAEVGYSYLMYGDFDGTAKGDHDEYSMTLDPGAKEHGFYVGVGMHYYF